ncbi:MAG: hypothetical protein ACJAX1_001152 [Neolewinella sp.]|jgi:hypothetical protein
MVDGINGSGTARGVELPNFTEEYGVIFFEGVGY